MNPFTSRGSLNIQTTPSRRWVTGPMLSVAALVLAIVGVWGVVAILFALLAGGIIHARDHQEAPYGGPVNRGVPAGPQTRFTP